MWISALLSGRSRRVNATYSTYLGHKLRLKFTWEMLSFVGIFPLLASPKCSSLPSSNLRTQLLQNRSTPARTWSQRRFPLIHSLLSNTLSYRDKSKILVRNSGCRWETVSPSCLIMPLAITLFQSSNCQVKFEGSRWH